MKKDKVNHPSHYTSDKSGVECIQITEQRNFNIGSSIKYLWRAGLKAEAGMSSLEKQLEDLDKAIFYIRAEKERLRRETPNAAGVIIKKILYKEGSNTKVLCKCTKCGKTYETWLSHFYKGRSLCGCTPDYSERLHTIWQNMIQRCSNPKNPAYGNYGGRGISVCAEWSDYNAFLEWAKVSGYKESLEIDRIDNNGNYAPHNCRWCSKTTNVRNRRVSTIIEIDGVKRHLFEWCEIYNIPKAFAQSRFYKKGKDVNDIVKFIKTYHDKHHKKLGEGVRVYFLDFGGNVIREFENIRMAADALVLDARNLRYWLSKNSFKLIRDGFVICREKEISEKLKRLLTTKK